MFRLPGYLGGEPEQPVSREVVATMAPPGEASKAPPRWAADFWVEAPTPRPSGPNRATGRS